MYTFGLAGTSPHVVDKILQALISEHTWRAANESFKVFFGEIVSQVDLLYPKLFNLAVHQIGLYSAVDVDYRVLLFESSSKLIVLLAATVNTLHKFSGRQFSQLKMGRRCTEENRVDHTLNSPMRANSTLNLRGD